MLSFLDLKLVEKKAFSIRAAPKFYDPKFHIRVKTDYRIKKHLITLENKLEVIKVLVNFEKVRRIRNIYLFGEELILKGYDGNATSFFLFSGEEYVCDQVFYCNPSVLISGDIDTSEIYIETPYQKSKIIFNADDIIEIRDYFILFQDMSLKILKFQFITDMNELIGTDLDSNFEGTFCRPKAGYNQPLMVNFLNKKLEISRTDLLALNSEMINNQIEALSSTNNELVLLITAPNIKNGYFELDDKFFTFADYILSTNIDSYKLCYMINRYSHIKGNKLSGLDSQQEMIEFPF